MSQYYNINDNFDGRITFDNTTTEIIKNEIRLWNGKYQQFNIDDLESIYKAFDTLSEYNISVEVPVDIDDDVYIDGNFIDEAYEENHEYDKDGGKDINYNYMRTTYPYLISKLESLAYNYGEKKELTSEDCQVILDIIDGNF